MMDQQNKYNQEAGQVGVQDEWNRPATHVSSGTPKVILLIMRASGGSITSEKQAAAVLIVFSIIALSISIWIFSLGGAKEAVIEAPAGETVVYPPNEPPRLDGPVR